MQLKSINKNSFSTKTIAIAYFSTVALFAGMFSFIPGDFHHSTIESEEAWLNSKFLFEDGFAQALCEALLGTTDYGVLIDGNIHEATCISRWPEFEEVYSLTQSDAYLLINLRTSAARSEEGPEFFGSMTTIAFDKNQSEQIDVRSSFHFIEDLNVGVVGEFNAEISRSSNNFSVLQSPSHETLPLIIVPITGLLKEKLAEHGRVYVTGLSGSAEYLPDKLARYLYLSAVTITTLGYGDIVPTTTRARLLITVETLLGIVLMGLFINAIFNDKRDKPR